MPETYPNQRMVRVHRERAIAPFLGIKNDNWQYALRDLGPYAFQLYLYCAANADNFTFALSPVAVRQAIGMARSTYRDQFDKMVDKGYLVPSNGNTFEFFELPQARAVNYSQSSVAACENDVATPAQSQEQAVQDVQSQSREININNAVDNGINNTNESQGQGGIYIPKVKEVVIPRPTAEGKNRPVYAPKEAVFDF